VLSLALLSPLALSERGARRVQVVVAEEEGRSEVTVYSQAADADASAEWTPHASAEVRRASDLAPKRLDIKAVRSRCVEAVDVESAYGSLASVGLEYGPAFQGMRSLHRGKGEAFAEVVLPEGVEGARAYGVHPALLDAAFQAVMGLSEDDALSLPFAMDHLTVYESGAMTALVHVRWHDNKVDDDASAVDVTLTDAQGQVFVEVIGLRRRPAEIEAIQERVTNGVSDALYSVEWPSVAQPAAESTLPAGRWLVVADEDDAVAEALTDELRARGAVCVRVHEVGRLEGELPAEHVVCVWGKRGREEAPVAAMRMANEGLVIAQTLARQSQASRLWWVTTGAVAVSAKEVPAVEQATLWGLGRTVRQEHPELDCTLIDVDGEAEVAVATDALFGELCLGDEPEVAWRKGKRHAARVVRVLDKPDLAPPRQLRTDGTVLVTGGLGALGLHVARWLVGRGVKHLVLTGRRGNETPGARQAVAELEGLGAQVTVAALDVADREALAAVVHAIPRAFPLRGVVHAAGVLDDGVLLEQTAERLARVMAPKVEGAQYLDALTQDGGVDMFVLFSSVAGTLGSAGQAGYAAANAFLDAVAAKRHSEGLPALSLAWGPWTDAEGKAAGLAAHLDGAHQARTVRSGLGAVSPMRGMALFEAAIKRGESQLMPVPLDLPRMRKVFEGAVPPVWRGLVRVSPRAGQGRKKGAWADELRALPETERFSAVLHVVRAEVARVLALAAPELVAAERPLKELGLDSLMAVELRNALGKRAGVRLPATLAFDYPTPTVMAQYLLHLQVSTQSEDADQLLREIETLDARLAVLGFAEKHNRIAERLVAIVNRLTSPSSSHVTATPLPDRSGLTDEELFGLIEQQALRADLEAP
jgi:NAD(P)-dependent dehydrogenase (short-subunit alcohol dehydrogenase family)/acyl carrier protein